METLRQQVLIALRDKILRRELCSGARVVERDLAAELGVSRSPVRECLLILQMEGLAEISPGLGVVVRAITSQQVREALRVRDQLDALAAREAALHHTDEDLVHIDAHFRLFELAHNAGDRERISSTDSKFHESIYNAAHNGVLSDVRLGFPLYESFYFDRDFYCYTPEDFARSLERHHQMLIAISSGDADAAEKASRLHIEEAIELVRDCAQDIAMPVGGILSNLEKAEVSNNV